MNPLHLDGPPFCPDLGELNVENFSRLADYLEKLPSEYSHFDMGVYLAISREDAEYERHFNEPSKVFEIMTGHESDGHQLQSHSCGTVACALGHAPLAGIRPLQYEDFTSYYVRNFTRRDPLSSSSHRFFSLPNPVGDRSLVQHPVWEWCFGIHWQWIDNTPIGAARRIRHLLAGLPILTPAEILRATSDNRVGRLFRRPCARKRSGCSG